MRAAATLTPALSGAVLHAVRLCCEAALVPFCSAMACSPLPVHTALLHLLSPISLFFISQCAFVPPYQAPACAPIANCNTMPSNITPSNQPAPVSTVGDMLPCQQSDGL